MSSIAEKLKNHLEKSPRLTDAAPYVKRGILPPVSISDFEAAEKELGFQLPPLLRDIYTQVGNGGFGPGYGFLKLLSLDQDKSTAAFTGEDDSIVEVYQEHLLWNSRRKLRKNSLDYWPHGVINLCNWGCNIYSCLDCTKPETPVLLFDPNQDRKKDIWTIESESFYDWLMNWLEKTPNTIG